MGRLEKTRRYEDGNCNDAGQGERRCARSAQSSLSSRLHDQMEMIGYQAHAEQFDGEFGFCRGEQVEEGSVVAVFKEDCRPTDSSIRNMVSVPGNVFARNVRHRDSTVRGLSTDTQE